MLLASLFLPWYERDIACIALLGFPCPRWLTGWQALALIDLVLAVSACLGLLLPVLSAMQRSEPLALVVAVLAALAGLLAALLVILRLVVIPGGLPGEGLRPAPGLVAGLVGGLGVACGGILSIRDEGFGVRPARDISPRPATEEDLSRIPKLPAPPPSEPL